MTDPARRARQLRKAELALRSIAEHGNAKAAAAELGVHETTVYKRVADYCKIFGYDSAIQAAYWLDRPRKDAA